MPEAKPTVRLLTYGCQMNEYDSELVASLLAENGYVLVDDHHPADIILVNTCAVRESANTRVYAQLSQWTHQKKEQPGLIVGVLGCIPQNLKDGLLEKFPGVDFVCGPDSYRRLPELIAHARAGGHEAAVDLSEYETYSDIAPLRVPGVNAWLAVMRGCDNFCSFCVVPFSRGRERSRTPESVLEETRQLTREGYKQVTLLGQNVNSYRSGDTDFAALIGQVAAVDGIERVRFTSPHPKDFPEHLIEVIAANPRICSHIHFPLQAGADRILKLMNRGYTLDDFLRLVEMMRAKIPNLALTTDIICGFPTETDADYQETVRAVSTVEFDSAFIFKYSEREGTPAAKRYPDDVPDDIKSERVTRLVALQREISATKNRAMIGQTVRVLIEGFSKKSPAVLRARTDSNKIVLFPTAPGLAVGDFCDVRISEVTPNTLLGQVV
jgi:tRNA-2-methylthio-N6-dimethylallyladenosine synthase